MRTHFKETHKEHTRSTEIKICSKCGVTYTNISKHNRICEKMPHGPHKWTEEERKIQSEKRKKYLKENPDKHPWKNKEKFNSIPCEKLKKQLIDDGFEFVEEYTDASWEHSYSIDIAILSKKIGIEVNGNQHYLRTGNLKPVYQRRHEYLESNGWKIIELHYANCFHEDRIKRIEDMIMKNTLIDESEHRRLFQNRKTKKIKIKKGQYKLPITVLEKRKEMILNSGVDLGKFGWQSEIAKITGLTRANIRDTISHFNEEFEKISYIRKSCR